MWRIISFIVIGFSVVCLKIHGVPDLEVVLLITAVSVVNYVDGLTEDKKD